ncbi:Hypothetical predicted protein [Marmota monax]|uniref:long-chain-fatty-acid--CoA ligase n=1 Tax=Marmota monax TaxID=9995 RepID=A0A5E4BIA2_MARMO|nr:Hypothetical predicted protein [Marmota monax]
MAVAPRWQWPLDGLGCLVHPQWHDFMELGSSIPDTQLDQIIKTQKANQCAVIIYTSGTVGLPKGVMLSHNNVSAKPLAVGGGRGGCSERGLGRAVPVPKPRFPHLRDGSISTGGCCSKRGWLEKPPQWPLDGHSGWFRTPSDPLGDGLIPSTYLGPNAPRITWMAGAVVRDLELTATPEHQEVVVSYLPLSHIAAQMMDMWVPIKIGAVIYFAESDALKGTLVHTLKEIKPTIFLGVPRIWEKMHDTIKENLAKASSLRKKAFTWAKDTGLKVNTKRMLG